jgi:threonine/homoserine efflux transporter RhtA
MFNQYSFISLALGLTAIAGVILLRNKPTWRDFLAFGTIVAGFIVAWIILHPVQTPLVGDAGKVQAQIGAGKPVLLEFQSPY